MGTAGCQHSKHVSMLVLLNSNGFIFKLIACSEVFQTMMIQVVINSKLKIANGTLQIEASSLRVLRSLGVGILDMLGLTLRAS